MLSQNNNLGPWIALALALLLSLSACGEEQPETAIDVECRLNSDCPGSQICEQSACVDDESVCVGDDCPCVSSADCGPGEACDLESGDCFVLACLNDSDCGLGEVCLVGSCETDVDADRDRDGVPDTEDLCPETQDADQEDLDGDLLGNACDPDDDNDGVPDTIDNCPEASNPDQADANDDAIGNLCDPIVSGTTVVGQLDFSAGGNPDTASASVSLVLTSGSEPVGIDEAGAFVFEQALESTGPFAIRVAWPGFVTLERIFNLPDDRATFDVGTLVLISEVVAELGATMRGQARLQGQTQHAGILVEALVGAVAVSSTVTNPEGEYVLDAARVDHTLRFSRENHLTETLDIVWDEVDEQFKVDNEPLDEIEGPELRPDRSASLAGRLTSTLEIPDWSDQIRVIRLSQEGGETLANVQRNGDFVLAETVVPGIYVLTIDARGHLLASIPVILEAGDNDLGEVALVPELEVPEEGVTLAGHASLNGRLDHSGIVVQALIGDNPIATTITDAEGRFAFQTARDNHTLVLTHPGFIQDSFTVAFSDQNERFQILGQALEDFDGLVLQPDLSADIEGRLTSLIEGFDFDDAEVTLVGQTRVSIDVSSDGQFDQANLAPGIYGLEITAPGHRTANLIAALDSGPNDQGEVALEPVEVSLSGLVVLDSEENHEDVVVRLTRDETLVATTLTDAEGVFTFRAIPVTYGLSLSKADFLPQSLTTTFEEGRFETAGQPLADTPIRLFRAPQSDRDRDGELDDLDNCVETFNPDQADLDGDGAGDRCDRDMDADGIANGMDNCPRTHNPMQEDPDQDGLGIACSGGTIDAPFILGCGVREQSLDTGARDDLLNGTCGGAGAPEVVYDLLIRGDERLNIHIDAGFAVVVYLLDEQGQQVACVQGTEVVFEGENHEDAGPNALAAGQYKLVIDGFAGAVSAGPMRITVLNSACSTTHTRIVDTAYNLTPIHVIYEDLNNDAIPDFIGLRSSGTVMLRHGLSNGLFGPQRNSAGNNGGERVAVGDFNGDGRPDLLISNGSTNVEVRLGINGLVFAAGQTFSVGYTISDLAAGDVNGDGHDDIVAVNEGGNSAFIYPGVGDGTFASEIPRLSGDNPQSVAVVDIDVDGVDDIITVNKESETVGIIYGALNAQFGRTISVDVGDRPTALAVADINGDGLGDVVTGADFAGDVVTILLAEPGRRWGQSRQIPLDGDSPGQIALGDTTGDGLIDLAVLTRFFTGNGFETQVEVFSGDGRGGFTPHSTFPAIDNVLGVDLEDANRDGVRDLIQFSRFPRILLASASHTFLPKRDLPAGEAPEDLLTVDLDEDGIAELVSIHNDSDTLTVRQGLGGGAFGEETTFNTPDGPNSVATGDFNGDGHADLITTSSEGSAPTVFAGDGEGGFTPVTLTGGPPVGDPTVGDFDNDGLDDVMMTLPGTQFARLFLGVDGIPFLRFVRTLGVPEETQALAVGDFDEDGDLDIVLASSPPLGSSGTSSVSRRLGNGAGNFGATSTLLTHPVVRNEALDVGDLNNDGHLDIVVSQGTQIALLTGNGDGTFNEPTFARIRDENFSSTSIFKFDTLTLADMDGDGDLDVLSANNRQDNVTLLSNRGNGNFLTQQLYRTDDQPIAIHTADVNGDGQPDILTANRDRDTLSILIQSSASLSQPGTALARSTQPLCPPASFDDLDEDDTTALWRPDEPCRIERAVLDLTFDPTEDPTALTLTTPLGTELQLPTSLPDWPGPGLWRPGQVSGLARLQDHPQQGTWSLDAPFDLDEARLLINTPPTDPLFPDTLAPTCESDVDQSPRVEDVCLLSDGLSSDLEDDADVDVFLLEGPSDGGFDAGLTVQITIETTPDADLSASLIAFPASTPLGVAEEAEPGTWIIEATVPPHFDGRYLALVLQAPDALDYTISVDP